MIRAAAFAVGLAAGVKVTRGLHGDAGFWGQRLGPTRLRNANLPLGGTLAITAATVLPTRLRRSVRALGAGAVLGAVGWGLVDPLPPAA